MSDSQPLPRHNPFQRLKLSFRLYRQHWREFVAIVGVGYTSLLFIYLIYLVLSFGASFLDQAEELTALLSVWVVTGGIFLIFSAQVLVRATVTRRVTIHLGGRSALVEVDGRQIFRISDIWKHHSVAGFLVLTRNVR